MEKRHVVWRIPGSVLYPSLAIQKEASTSDWCLPLKFDD